VKEVVECRVLKKKQCVHDTPFYCIIMASES